MHEAGIAASILSMAEDVARRHGARAVAAVTVRVGGFSGVLPGALEFAFAALREGTLAGRAQLIIESVAIEARCPRCHTCVHPETELLLWCAACGTPLDVVAGNELEIRSVDLEEPETCNV